MNENDRTYIMDTWVNNEDNRRRITKVESCFGNAGQPLKIPGRILIGEGVLTKMCRKKPKARQFFLFNDLLVYGNIVINRKKYNKQHIIPLEEIKLESLEDENNLRNGWVIRTRGKSFAVFAATATEKNDWMLHIGRCTQELLKKSGKKQPLEHAAVWVPDSSATVCMNCHKSQFNVLNRRHHCRHCGSVVCGTCSSNRFLLPNLSSKPIRVCDPCNDFLIITSKTEITSDQNLQNTEENDSGFEIRNHPGLVGQSCTRRPQLSTVIEEDPDRISQDRKSIFNEKISSDPPVTCKNPKLSELVQMSHESSFWWDSRESNLEIGQDNCDDGITHAIIEHYNEGSKPNDSSGEDDSDDDDQNINEEQNDTILPPNFYTENITSHENKN